MGCSNPEHVHDIYNCSITKPLNLYTNAISCLISPSNAIFFGTDLCFSWRFNPSSVTKAYQPSTNHCPWGHWTAQRMHRRLPCGATEKGAASNHRRKRLEPWIPSMLEVMISYHIILHDYTTLYYTLYYTWYYTWYYAWYYIILYIILIIILYIILIIILYIILIIILYIILHYTTLYCIILNYTTLYYIILYCNILSSSYTALYCMLLYYTIV